MQMDRGVLVLGEEVWEEWTGSGSGRNRLEGGGEGRMGSKREGSAEEELAQEH